jgi:undecaprenyl diphosphate synthase
MADLANSGNTDERMQPGPRHIAIIMDGNGRWAAQRGLPRAEGHRRGVEAVRSIVQAAIELDIPYLTVFSFSSENWTRPASEISDLLGLMKRFIRRDLATLHRHGVRIKVIGEGADDGEILGLIGEAEALTAANTGLNLIVAFNYGSRAEIVRAARHLAGQVKAGTLAPEDISPERFAGELQTAGLPDPDLLIRTSGEHRLSNFLLWQLAYAEFVFVDTYWPDFTKEHLAAAIDDYRRRDRRYGGLSQRAQG